MTKYEKNIEAIHITTTKTVVGTPAKTFTKSTKKSITLPYISLRRIKCKGYLSIYLDRALVTKAKNSKKRTLNSKA